MPMRPAEILDRTYARIARVDAAVALARRARGVADAVIGKRLAPTTLPEHNGELWLADRVADRVVTALDVGANVGDWSAMALARFPHLRRLIAYEPGLVGGVLRERLAGDPRAEVVAAAVSDRPGSIAFVDETSDSKLSSALTPAGATARTVAQVSLDEELAARAVERVDFVKIDVEGLDLHVLRGAREALERQRLAIVQFEYGPLWQDAGSTLRAAARLLGDAGYRMLLIGPDALHEFDVLAQTELYVYANFVALTPDAAAALAPWIRPGW